MAGAVGGRLEAFNPDLESITVYLERVELYFCANEVKREKQVPVFLNLLGRETYALLRNLVSPVKPAEKSLNELMDALRGHFEPKKLVTAARFQFHQRQQQAGESVSTYLAELRKMAVPCEFGDSLSECLKDRLVCGLRNEAHQKRLLSEPELTLDKAQAICQSLETAELNAQTLRGSDPMLKQLSQDRRQRMHAQSQRRGKTPPHNAQRVRECFRCGGPDHVAANCRFAEYVCRKCNKKGHLARVCRSQKFASRNGKVSGAGAQAHQLTSADPGSEEEQPLHRLEQHKASPIKVNVQVNGVPVSMELDTGAAVSVMSQQQQKELFPTAQLQPSKVILRTYTAQSVGVVGTLPVKVVYEEQEKDLSLFIVQGKGPALFGRDWLASIKLRWPSIAYHSVGGMNLEELLRQFGEVFRPELGTSQTPPVHLSVKEHSQPKFFRPRPVPFAIKDALARELEHLEDVGVLTKVEFSRWATPIVPVPKKDGTFRICGDFKVTVNPALEVDQHPIPKPEDIFASLSGGQRFSTLDLTQAYQQLVLDEESKELVTINTHLGLYRFNRLPFGVASAPAIFQRTMDQLLHGLSGVMCYLDDIIVTGADDQEHLTNLAEVLGRLRAKGFRLKKEKCHFFKPVVEYLGHLIDAQGLHTTPSKQQAIVEARAPTNITELRSFLGLVNYYGRFIPNLATVLHPLNHMLRKGACWNWTQQCQKAFQEIKEILGSPRVLAHYNPSLPLTLAADASAYGVGAVISQTYPDGTERPIAYASRTLTQSEKNYAQLEKEALALVFGVKRFHQFLYGRKFTLFTDHKPLTTILGPYNSIPTLAAARLQRWALILSAYKYEIRFRRTEEHANADCLSRLPLISSPGPERSVEATCFNLGQVHALPVTAAKLSECSRQDPLVSRVMQFTRRGWPATVATELKPYHTRRHELTVEGQCLLWGIRVVVPRKLRQRLLEDLHRDHGGVVRMKSLARSVMWWPGMDADIEALAKACTSCKAVKSAPSQAPLHPWRWPEFPWQRIHMDFAGPFRGKMFMLLVDAHSKWPEILEMTSTTADSTIATLRRVFAAFGLPEQLVTDNGPQFVSREFADFVQGNGIKHIRTAPYHPSSNGAVERLVQTFKQAMKAGECRGLSLQHQLQSFLMSYRSTPHATTGQSPASLFLGRPIRTRFDLLRPELGRKVRGEQARQKQRYDAHTRFREFAVGDKVMIRDGRDKSQWRPGTVMEKRGPVSYQVELESGVIQHRHVDHLREWVPARVTNAGPPVVTASASDHSVISTPTPASLAETPSDVPHEQSFSENTPAESPHVSQEIPPPVTTTESAGAHRRYPRRHRYPVDRYGFS